MNLTWIPSDEKGVKIQNLYVHPRRPAYIPSLNFFPLPRKPEREGLRAYDRKWRQSRKEMGKPVGRSRVRGTQQTPRGTKKTPSGASTSQLPPICDPSSAGPSTARAESFSFSQPSPSRPHSPACADASGQITLKRPINVLTTAGLSAVHIESPPLAQPSPLGLRSPARPMGDLIAASLSAVHIEPPPPAQQSPLRPRSSASTDAPDQIVYNQPAPGPPAIPTESSPSPHAMPLSTDPLSGMPQTSQYSDVPLPRLTRNAPPVLYAPESPLSSAPPSPYPAPHIPLPAHTDPPASPACSPVSPITTPVSSRKTDFVNGVLGHEVSCLSPVVTWKNGALSVVPFIPVTPESTQNAIPNVSS